MNSTTDPADAIADGASPAGDAASTADAVAADGVDDGANTVGTVEPERAESGIAGDGEQGEADSATDAESGEEGESGDGSAPTQVEGTDAAATPAVDEPHESELDIEPDPALFESHDLALAALREITPASTIGEVAGHRVERGGVVSLRFENRLPGYPGWFWTVSLARVEGSEPTVLEVELLPGDGALLAPDWVPWAVRLAEYQAAQVALAEAPHASDDEIDDDADEDLDDVDDLDAADFDEDGSRILHAGDVDGVDIDELDDSDDDDDEDDSDEDEDSDDDDSDEDEDSDEDSDDDSDEDEDSDEDDDDSDEDDSDEDDDAEE